MTHTRACASLWIYGARQQTEEGGRPAIGGVQSLDCTRSESGFKDCLRARN